MMEMCKFALLVVVLALVLSGAVSAEECHYELAGDWNLDCKVDFVDFALMAASWLIDCGAEPNNPACVPLDIDGDGYDVSIDCNDNDPNISPGKSEVCGNGIDDDCDGLIDGDDDPNCTAYSHTIVIDGVKDFTADETFETSSTGSGFTGYISWDSQYLYIGREGYFLDGGGETDWLLVYIGGPTGTTTGLVYNTQQPSLAFGAGYHIRWRGDDVYVNLLEYNGATWVDAGWPGDAHMAGEYLEMRVPLTSIGSPSMVQVHLNVTSHDISYAAVPSTSFTDGYDPDYTKYFEFDLTSPAVPISYTPLP
jgi:hypothetical protein